MRSWKAGILYYRRIPVEGIEGSSSWLEGADNAMHTVLGGMVIRSDGMVVAVMV